MENVKDRFSFDKEGTKIKYMNNEYSAEDIETIKEIQKMMNTFFEQLEINDIVRLKETNDIVRIKQLKDTIDEQYNADYIGEIINSNKYIMFNQEDILEKINDIIKEKK